MISTTKDRAEAIATLRKSFHIDDQATVADNLRDLAEKVTKHESYPQLKSDILGHLKESYITVSIIE